MYLPVWLEAREHCLAVANAMPEELYSYKPTEVNKTFAEQLVHIAHTVELLTQRYVQGMEVKPNTPDASKMTKAAIIKLLEEGFDYTTNVIYTIEQKQLDEKRGKHWSFEFEKFKNERNQKNDEIDIIKTNYYEKDKNAISYFHTKILESIIYDPNFHKSV